MAVAASNNNANANFCMGIAFLAGPLFSAPAAARNGRAMYYQFNSFAIAAVVAMAAAYVRGYYSAPPPPKDPTGLRNGYPRRR